MRNKKVFSNADMNAEQIGFRTWSDTISAGMVHKSHIMKFAELRSAR